MEVPDEDDVPVTDEEQWRDLMKTMERGLNVLAFKMEIKDVDQDLVDRVRRERVRIGDIRNDL